MNAWDRGRWFPSSTLGGLPRQELNSLSVTTSAVVGVISLAVPAAWTAFFSLAAASGLCLATTPPYCRVCRQVTRHRHADRSNAAFPADGKSAGRVLHVFVDEYYCRECGSKLVRHKQLIR